MAKYALNPKELQELVSKPPSKEHTKEPMAEHGMVALKKAVQERKNSFEYNGKKFKITYESKTNTFWFQPESGYAPAGRYPLEWANELESR